MDDFYAVLGHSCLPNIVSSVTFFFLVCLFDHNSRGHNINNQYWALIFVQLLHQPNATVSQKNILKWISLYNDKIKIIDIRPFTTEIHDRLKNQRNSQKNFKHFFFFFSQQHTEKCDRREKQNKSELANEVVDNADVVFFSCMRANILTETIFKCHSRVRWTMFVNKKFSIQTSVVALVDLELIN